MSNTQEYFGLKELSSVVIKTIYDMKIGNRQFKAGEPVLYFEKVQISELDEKSHIKIARGGHGNFAHVIWEDYLDLHFRLTEGVLSKTSFSILSNMGVCDYQEDEETLKIPKRQILTVDNNNNIKLMYEPLSEQVFAYLLNDDGVVEKSLEDFLIPPGKIVHFNEDIKNRNIAIDYYFNYTRKHQSYILSDKRIDGFLKLEGKAYFKDDIHGMNRTFFFEIPKMKITSNLDIIMGEKASPTVSVFNIIGVPIKSNGQWIVSNMYLLDDDIDADI